MIKSSTFILTQYTNYVEINLTIVLHTNLVDLIKESKRRDGRKSKGGRLRYRILRFLV